MAQVHDDYIGQILDFGEDRRFAYVVYPLYRPGSLARYCKEIGAGRTLKWCAQIIYQMLSGLMTASELGLVHLDLKPGNIVLDGQHPRIIDWGLSRTWNASEPGDLVVRGTPFYACPERIVSPHAARATPLTDLYGLGATFYWMLAGEAPLQLEAQASGGGSALETYRDLILSGVRPQPVHELVPGVPGTQLADRPMAELHPGRPGPCGNTNHRLAASGREELATLLPSLPAANVGLPLTLRSHRWAQGRPRDAIPTG